MTEPAAAAPAPEETAEVDFDVIVVGAGIAGCVTAYQLARQGRSVVLIERGEAPGSKNLSGGVLYCRVLESVFPGFVDRAPVERRITRNVLSFLNDTSHLNVDYWDSRLAEPVNAVTVLRAKLDPWMAAECEQAGVVVMPGVRVDALLRAPLPDHDDLQYLDHRRQRWQPRQGHRRSVDRRDPL